MDPPPIPGSLPGGPSPAIIVGKFNRAQRALQNLNEIMPAFTVDFFLSGYVFPLTTAILTAGFGVFRLKGALDYTEERGKRMSGNMAANFLYGGMGGMILAIGLHSTRLQMKKL